MQKAANLTNEIMDVLRNIGIKGFIEESGCRGYHIWILFTGWISVRYINLFQEILEEKIPALDDTLTVEFFPNRSHSKNGKVGQSIKLPLGYHIRTGKRSHFLTEDFEIVADQGNYIQHMARYSIHAIKNIIGTYSSYKDNATTVKTVDDDLSSFTEASENVILVLKQCNLMRYLCQKARTTGYLSHFERLSLLYVFGHMGDEGAEFLHQVMSFTLNYQYHVTQRFISKVPAKPVSCIKLRDQYRNITAEYGCNCNFNRIKDCYPSPVLHALKKGTDNAEKITVPTSRTLSKEKESKVCSELNINQKVQDVTGKILEFKKQKRAIDKNIVKLEKELEKIFDEANIDCMEVEFGMLTRRKKDGGYEWIVEI